MLVIPILFGLDINFLRVSNYPLFTPQPYNSFAYVFLLLDFAIGS
jgi:hypothetical protein